MAVESASRDPWDFLVVDDRYAVLHHGYVASEERDVEGLPDIGLSRLLRRWVEEAIHATGVVAVGLGCRVRFDLDFVTAAQEDAAVGVDPAVEFNMQLEVFELGGVDEIGAVAVLYQRAILSFPGGFLALAAWNPAG